MMRPRPGGFVPDAEARQYLTGETLSSGRAFRVRHVRLQNRLDLLVAWCHQKTVLHIGFADHAEVVETKRAQRVWLHDRICDVAARCVGLDTSKETVEKLRAAGITDVRAADVTELADDDPLLAEHWDVVLLGEVLEHVDNPVQFLRRIAQRFDGRIGDVVVTVPNAWSLTVLRGAFRSREIINTDHRFWFTPYTLAKVLTEAGLKLEEVHLVEYTPPLPRRTVRSRTHDAIVGQFDLFRACCVARARPVA